MRKNYFLLFSVFGLFSHAQDSKTTLKPNSTTGTATTQSVDYSKFKFAPNSYIFDPAQANDGLYIPVAKAYAMWSVGDQIGGSAVPAGVSITADVLWEDTPGLIKSGTGYALEIIGSGENAKIKIPVNKTKKGNAVISYKVDGQIYWSWHVWVTDDPTNGSTYKSFDVLKRVKNDGTVELIPASDWKWMDRNLGAIENTITAGDWMKNGGLLYQWGRKDPIPPLQYKGNDFYEVTGSIGRIRHKGFIDHTSTPWTPFDDMKKFVSYSQANVTDNIKLSVRNPLSLIYVNADNSSQQAYYNNNTNLPVNWFGNKAGLEPKRISELNLWSDNSMGIPVENYNADASAAPYRNKSSFDPCPNGWRIPSVLVSNMGIGDNWAYSDNVRLDFFPFGPRTNATRVDNPYFNSDKLYVIKPTDANSPSYFKGIKLYANVGFDLTSYGNSRFDYFPGTGSIARLLHGGIYTDQHHVTLWTATMANWGDGTPVVGSRMLTFVADKGQQGYPDPANFPIVKGFYVNDPIGGVESSGAAGCRCIKDPLYIVNDYNFITEYFKENQNYLVGLDNPNSYVVVKSAAETQLSIPISKAFSVQSGVLGNASILDPQSFNNLKVNVLWTDNKSLINTASISNPTPMSLNSISNDNIIVKIAPNQSGNAVVTLHNGSIANPIYWSWHIWVTNSEIEKVQYKTDDEVAGVDNYINFVQEGSIMATEFMDRNLGARDVFPNVAALNASDMEKLKWSGGLQYQWGRKDPIPSFSNVDNSSYDIYLGSVSNDGSITYTTLTSTNYASQFVATSTNYNSASNVVSTDKLADKISKVLTYSVKNPLAFMQPSVANQSVGVQTPGSDWLTSDVNEAPDRWGRGGAKSVFDPCPEGWRVPDVLATALANVNLGFTPFYKKGQNESAEIPVTSYFGVAKPFGKGGFVFVDSDYKIGNFPVTGVRGERNTLDGSKNSNSDLFGGVSRIWTAGLSYSYGRPINMTFNWDNQKMKTFDDNSDPYYAANCRCVKVKKSQKYGNKEDGPLEVVPFDSGTLGSNDIPKEVLNREKLIAFPNPVHSTLQINGKPNKVYEYQVFDMSGKIVKSGKFLQNETDLSSLLVGIYIIRINNNEAVIKILKK